MFPIPPQWDKRVIETLSWKTNIITSYNGSEQRIGLMREPRKTIQFDITTNNQETQKLDSIMMNWLARPFAIPVWQDITPLVTQATIGTSVLEIDTIGRDFVVGNSVAIFESFEDIETGEVTAVTDTEITLRLPLLATHPKGVSVYPIRIGRLPDKQSMGFLTPKVDTAKMVFNVTKNENVAATEAAGVYRTLPILEERPNYSAEITTEYASKVQIIDNQLAEPYVDLETDFIQTTSAFTWVKTTKAGMQSLREMLHARRGRKEPIWVPTWKNDLTLVNGEVSGAALLVVKPHDRTLHVDGLYSRRDIMVLKTNGDRFYCRVSSSSDEGSTEELALDTPLPFDLPLNEVALICYIEICRLSSDTVEIEWITPVTSKVTVGFTTLYYDV
jgi:hypothetical protein